MKLKIKSLKQYIVKIWDITGRKRSLFWVIFFSTLVLALFDIFSLALIIPVTIGLIDENTVEFLDFNGMGSGFEWSYEFILLLLLVVILTKTALGLYLNWLIVSSCNSIARQIRKKVFDVILFGDYTAVSNLGMHNIIENLTLVDKFSNSFLYSILKTMSDLFIVLTIFLFLVSLNPTVVLILMAVAVIFIWSYYATFKNLLREWGEKVNSSAASMIDSIRASYLLRQEINAYGSADFFRSRYLDESTKNADAQSLGTIVTRAPRLLLESLFYIMFCGLLFLLDFMLDYSKTEIVASVAVFGAAGLRIFPIANQVAGAVIRIRLGRDMINRLGLIVDLNTDAANVRGLPAMTSVNELRFDDVWFSYGDSVEVLKGVNLAITPGEPVALIGPSGAGKSTLLGLMLGILKPSLGRVAISSGAEEYGAHQVQGRFASIVSQDCPLAPGTLAENVALTSKVSDLELARINDILVRLGLLKELGGLESSVDTGGSQISGGQRQRLAIARALYFRRPIMVFDEPSNSLDSARRKQVKKMIFDLAKTENICVLWVTHLEDELEGFNFVYRLENGRAVMHERRPNG